MKGWDAVMKAVFRLLPTIAISRIMGVAADSKRLGRALVWVFAFAYRRVNWHQARNPNASEYETLNDAFVRPLAINVRGRVKRLDDAVVSPAQGVLTASGTIDDLKCSPVKGFRYDVATLLGDAALAKTFQHGEFGIIYLAPHHYHRVHAPVEGVLRAVVHIPGRLLPVNNTGIRLFPDVLSQNERMVFVQDVGKASIATVMVGAFGVGSIQTDMVSTRPHPKKVIRDDFASEFPIPAGEEMGKFLFGSSVVLLSSEPMELVLPQDVDVGDVIGRRPH